MRRFDVAVVIPTRRGGDLLARSVARIRSQEGIGELDLLLVDSGSSPEELRRLAALGARIRSIDPSTFDHGETRDLGVRWSRGEIVVFLNQDALPIGSNWLFELLRPFSHSNPPAAVQGAIVEWPEARAREAAVERFFWDSCGPRFYFTSESREWIERHGGIGFSTVHCAIARSAMAELPFGRAPILEDKLWQKGARERGWRIVEAPTAVVWHTHDYDLPGLVRRCASEGFGWRQVGVRYSLRTAIRDIRRESDWTEWRRGRRSDKGLRPAELLFPIVRPLALWWGSRWSRRVHLG